TNTLSIPNYYTNPMEDHTTQLKILLNEISKSGPIIIDQTAYFEIDITDPNAATKINLNNKLVINTILSHNNTKTTDYKHIMKTTPEFIRREKFILTYGYSIPTELAIDAIKNFCLGKKVL